MKGNEKSVLIGMAIVAVLLVLAAYKFFYSADVEEAEKVQKETNNLQTRLNELNEKNANRSMYDAGIKDSGDIIDAVLSLYGPGNTPEKTIMTVVDMCNMTGCTVSTLAFEDDKLVYSNASGDGESADIEIYKGGMSLNLSCGYTQLKKITDYINSYPERMNAENFSVAFDSDSGKLSVTMKVNMYSVHDDKHQYVAPVIEDIELGSANIFKTAETPAEEETEEGEGETPAENNTTESPETSNTNDSENSNTSEEN